MTRDTRNHKNHDEIPFDEKEKDVTFENIMGMVKFQHQQLKEVRDTFEANLTKCRTELQANLTKCRTELQENINQLSNQLTNQIQMITQAFAFLETSSNRKSRARDSDDDGTMNNFVFILIQVDKDFLTLMKL
ncbi:hypothetical protein GOBAR_DD05526 [Gossypium barbadense]|nr:hypothetical protein GOBAR_DD05526 [Gossypium barbadense]